MKMTKWALALAVMIGGGALVANGMLAVGVGLLIVGVLIGATA